MFPSRMRVGMLMLFSYIVVKECKGTQAQGYNPAPECKRVDCPIYSVIHSEKEFEIRSYSEALWMSSSPFPDDTIMGALGLGAARLSDYYRQVGMYTASPIIYDVLNSLYEVYKYVPTKYQNGSNLPEPAVSTKIHQVKLPKHKYAAVRRFDVIDDRTIALQFDALKRNLRGTDYQRAVELHNYSVAFYDPDSFNQGNVYEVFIWFD